ncbi:MAG: DUF2207 domain-containing protein [Cyanobacteria bacterium P01_G01_bin.49]
MSRKLIKRTAYFLITLFFAFSIPLTDTFAQNSILYGQQPFYWEHINVNIDVQTNGDMLITEEQKYVFESDHTNQRYRYIPLDKVDEIKDVVVRENGKIIPSQTGTQNNQLWISWQHQLNPPEEHTFILKYRVVGGLQTKEENTQVYWKAIFADRKAPIQAAKVRVKLPQSLSDKVLSFKTFGTPASTRAVDSRTLEFVASSSIKPQQELEVQIIFPSEILNIPGPEWQRFDSKKTQDFFSRIVQQFGIFIIIILLFLGIVIGQVLARRCPQCRKFTLKTRSKVIKRPTSYTNGTKRVTQHCNNCSFHREFEKTISRNSSSSSSSGGGSCGGGGGDDGGGGGGGG